MFFSRVLKLGKGPNTTMDEPLSPAHTANNFKDISQSQQEETFSPVALSLSSPSTSHRPDQRFDIESPALSVCRPQSFSVSTSFDGFRLGRGHSFGGMSEQEEEITIETRQRNNTTAFIIHKESSQEDRTEEPSEHSLRDHINTITTPKFTPQVIPPKNAADIFGVGKDLSHLDDYTRESLDYTPKGYTFSPIVRNTPNTAAPLAPVEAPLPITSQQLQTVFKRDIPYDKREIAFTNAAQELFIHAYYSTNGSSSTTITTKDNEQEIIFMPCTTYSGILPLDSWRGDDYYVTDDICFCNRCVFLWASNHVARGGVLPCAFTEVQLPLHTPDLTHHCRSRNNRRILQPIAEFPQSEDAANCGIDEDDDAATQLAADQALYNYTLSIQKATPLDLHRARIIEERNVESMPLKFRVLHELYISRFLQGYLNTFNLDNIIYPIGYNPTIIRPDGPEEARQFELIASHTAQYKQYIDEQHSRGVAIQEAMNIIASKIKSNRDLYIILNHQNKQQAMRSNVNNDTTSNIQSTHPNSTHLLELKTQIENQQRMLDDLRGQYKTWQQVTTRQQQQKDLQAAGAHFMVGWTSARHRTRWLDRKNDHHVAIFFNRHAMPEFIHPEQRDPTQYNIINNNNNKKLPNQKK